MKPSKSHSSPSLNPKESRRRWRTGDDDGYSGKEIDRRFLNPEHLSPKLSLSNSIKGSPGGEDIQGLFDRPDDDHVKEEDSGVGEARGGKENVRVADMPSSIDEGELLDISLVYQIPLEYQLIRPKEQMRITEPLDKNSIMMYEESFRSGVRLFLSESLKSFFNEYNITISQLHPNGLRFLCGIIALAHQDEHVLTARVVWELYHIGVHPNEDHCFLQAEKDRNIMALKKVKNSEIKKVAEAMRKQAATESLVKEVLAAVLDQQTPEVGETLDIQGYFMKKYGVSCSLQENGPSRKMARHCLFPADVRCFDYMDDLDRKDFVNQAFFQALNANNLSFAQIT
ncbi:hypothetical protein JCGZ_11543 [Jatropha curcas]|uniref:Uncharacterized protein n=1 Tax=Jatropha curcas TaxID=180498 RepID=A0A067K4V9_JATCU|nr:hypothetical protein JCGZ_11543 [Jatropha curcas]